jgi:bifunctional non-homologous end joining protein LigD
MLQRTFPAGFIAPCLPTKTDKLPSGDPWRHEIKHDGFRLIARKDGDRVRLYSRPGNDMTRRFPLIVDALSDCARAPAFSMGRRLLATTTAWRRSISFATTATTTVSSSTPST